MKSIQILTGILIGISLQTQAFCGFYVAKADGKLFNKSSQVIVVRNGDQSTITMANDYQGNFNEFAMVVPVPVVLQKNDIKVVNKDIFERFDGYSAPRLAEYYDENPCYEYELMENAASSMDFFAVRSSANKNMEEEIAKKVTIEAKYEVGEYDILILSSKESAALQIWLQQNGYKIPPGAQEVLAPYIKDDMKFFVAKVNLDRLKQKNGTYLSPIQISFNSPKFMLPIRLGMANANGTQDLIVYLLTQNGRVETANYRTQEMPSNKNIPLFVENHFGDFYKSVFSKAWTNNKSSVFVEYSWDLNGNNFTKCDPCNTTPPSMQELSNAGVNWLNFSGNRWGAQYSGNLHFTRLHVRYDRAHFPQDLQFTETRNKQNFQCRYVLTHPAQVNEGQCDAVLGYYKTVQKRREQEMINLGDLTWWNTTKYDAYLQKYQSRITDKEGPDINNIERFSLWPSIPSEVWLPLSLITALILAGGLLQLRKTKGLK